MSARFFSIAASDVTDRCDSRNSDAETSPLAATSSLDAESGTCRFPSPISLQPQSRKRESRPSLSRSQSRSTSVTARTSRRSEDAPMRGRQQKGRSKSRDRLRSERGRRTATRSVSRSREETRGRRRSRSQSRTEVRRGRDRSRSKDRRVERRARSRSPKSTYSSITPQNGRYGSVGFDRSAPKQVSSGFPAHSRRGETDSFIPGRLLSNSVAVAHLLDLLFLTSPLNHLVLVACLLLVSIRLLVIQRFFRDLLPLRPLPILLTTNPNSPLPHPSRTSSDSQSISRSTKRIDDVSKRKSSLNEG